MTAKQILVNAALQDYIEQVGVRETELQRQLRAETARLPEAGMQISVGQGAFLSMLVQLLAARRCLEIGVFTGYSSLSVALALPAQAQLICLDIHKNWTDIARRYWQEAGVADRIELRLAPALESLTALKNEYGAGSFDFVFLDADKENYENYYEAALALLRAGGVIAIDNTLWSGKVANADEADPETRAIRSLNAKLHADRRVDLVLLPLADGLTLVRKR